MVDTRMVMGGHARDQSPGVCHSRAPWCKEAAPPLTLARALAIIWPPSSYFHHPPSSFLSNTHFPSLIHIFPPHKPLLDSDTTTPQRTSHSVSDLDLQRSHTASHGCCCCCPPYPGSASLTSPVSEPSTHLRNFHHAAQGNSSQAGEYMLRMERGARRRWIQSCGVLPSTTTIMGQRT